MSRPRIQIILIDQKGTKGCHRGHKIGDSYDFDTERGNLCPMAMHVAFPYVDILRYGGEIPGNPKGTAIFACPDVDGGLVGGASLVAVDFIEIIKALK